MSLTGPTEVLLEINIESLFVEVQRKVRRVGRLGMI